MARGIGARRSNELYGGLLGDYLKQAGGLLAERLGAVTDDPRRILADYVATAALASTGDPEAKQAALDQAAMSTGLLGDFLGPLADAHRFLQFPEDRTAGNAALAGLGALPFIPHMGGMVKSGAPKIPYEDALIVQHNMSIENLLHANRMGGMAMPSIGISKAANPIDGYGDIVLLADPQMVKPSARNPVYSADAYSPTYPSIKYSIDDKQSKILDEYLASPYGEKSLWDVPLSKNGGRYVYNAPNDVIERSGFQGVQDVAYKAKFLDEKDIMPSPANFADRYEWEVAINEVMRNSNLLNEYDVWTATLPDRLGIALDEKLFDGFTNMGRPRYKQHTLDNVLKAMRKDLKDNQTGMFGSGALRAQVAPRFKSMKEIKNARDRLISGDSWREIKKTLNEEMNERLLNISSKFNDYAKYSDSNPFIQNDLIRDQLTEIATGVSHWDDYFNDVPDSLKKEWTDYLEELKNIPTTYFEAKPNRIVDLNEFAGALLPQGGGFDEAENILRGQNIGRIERYADEADKVEKLKFFQDLYFSGLLGAAGLGAASYGLLGYQGNESM